MENAEAVYNLCITFTFRKKSEKCKPILFSQNAKKGLKWRFVHRNKRKTHNCGKLFRAKEKTREKTKETKNENKKKKQKEKKLKNKKAKKRGKNKIPHPEAHTREACKSRAASWNTEVMSDDNVDCRFRLPDYRLNCRIYL